MVSSNLFKYEKCNKVQHLPFCNCLQLLDHIFQQIYLAQTVLSERLQNTLVKLELFDK